MTGQHSDGPALLRRERTSRGYSQQDLATASRLSVRTVRGLESGTIDRPRHDTLTRVCDALGLANQDRSAFLATWGLAADRRVVAPDEMLLEPERHASLLDAVRRRKNELSYAYTHDVISVNEHGNIVAEDFTRLCVAEVSGLRVTPIVWISDTPQAQQACRVGRMRGCAAHRQTVIDDVTTVLELEFPRPLALGESHLFRYSRAYDFAEPVPPPDGDDPWMGRCAMIGLHRGGRVCIVEVRFARGHLPRRCTHLLMRRLGGAYEQVRDLDIGPDGQVQLGLVDPVAGWHGIGWEW